MPTELGMVQLGSHHADERARISEAIDCMCHALEAFDFNEPNPNKKLKASADEGYQAIAEVVHLCEKLERDMFGESE